MSALELAELILERRKKEKKRKRQEEVEITVKKPKRRRFVAFESGSSEDEKIDACDKITERCVNMSEVRTKENATSVKNPVERFVNRASTPKKVPEVRTKEDIISVSKVNEWGANQPSTSKNLPGLRTEESFINADKLNVGQNSKSKVRKSDVKICTEQTKPSIFIASRQIASAPEIATSLRAKWNVQVHVRSLPGADFIVSWRLGINRITLSGLIYF